MPRMSKAAARAWGVDFTGPFVDIVDDLGDWLETIRPSWDCEAIWEKADELAHRWVEERAADAG